MRFLTYPLVAIVAAVILAFAFANRELVVVRFDPLGDAIAPVSAPEFLVLMLAAALGVVAGGVATWASQGRYRRAARRAEAEVARLRAQLQAAPPAAPSRALVRQA